jgi:epoxyqueuosine reductase QueG
LKNFELKDRFKNFSYAICIGYHLSKPIIENIKDKPTKEYFFHYRLVNSHLDNICLKITEFIQREDYSAYPVPASQIIDWEKQEGVISHKILAYNAGLGFRGRCNLLINPRYGARIRLASVLTDYPLEVDSPLNENEFNCGDCKRCLEICPAGAIKENYKDFLLEKCKEQLKIFSKTENLSQYICGICVKACKEFY